MSGAALSFASQGRLAILQLRNPPVNALSHALRQAIDDNIDIAIRKGAKVILFHGSGKTFSAGADINEFQHEKRAKKPPTLAALVQKILNLKMHTIAVIHGAALGGGLEIALSCQYRLMHESAKCGLPEVHLGILPGAGGTQLLPRLVGCEQAIRMMTTGKPITSAQALEIGLADAVIPKSDDLLVAAISQANALIDKPVDASRVLSNRRVAEPPGGDTIFFDTARALVCKAARGEEAPGIILDAVKVAYDSPSFDIGVNKEQDLFSHLIRGEQSEALRHVFFAERQIGKVGEAIENAEPKPIRNAVVIGAGTMGIGISISFLSKFIPVTIVDNSKESISAAQARISKEYERAVDKGRLKEDDKRRQLSMLSFSDCLDCPAMCDADIVIEAVFERMDIKKGIFRQLDAICKSGALLCTNTSTLNIDDIANATSRPQDVCGTHFFSPANIMPLLENVRGRSSSDQTLASVMALGKKLGKKAVLAGNCFGFIGNRMIESYGREACFLLEEGCLPQQVDTALQEFGIALGPLAMSDLAGNDIGYNVRREMGWANSGQCIGSIASGHQRYSTLADKLVEAGRLGQKTRRGWYDYPHGRQPVPSTQVDDLISSHRMNFGFTPRDIGTQEIVDRCLLPLVNEGFKCVEEGIALRESDVDIVYIYGYGFPRRLGGPMYWAKHIREGGLPKLVRDLVRLGGDNLQSEHWKPSSLLLREAAQSKL